MSSRRTEDFHISVLQKLLSDMGLVCFRSPSDSPKSESIVVEEEQEPVVKEEEEKLQEQSIEEEKVVETEPIVEEEPEIFPTPSLRKVLPDRVREIEAQNRIHVLPNQFNTDIDPTMIPKIATTAQQKYIEILADLTGCKEFRSSLAEFWFLDTLANLLRRAQEDELTRHTQALLILWFCEWMKEMQYFDAADRRRMMKRFQDNMLAAATFVGEQCHIPSPAEVGVYYKAQEPTQEGAVPPTPKSIDSKPLVTFEGTEYECALQDLISIMHYIFDLFSTDYQYDLVRSVFTFTPEYTLIDAPYQLQNPKSMYAPLKYKAKKEKAEKKDTKAAKGKKKDVETAEYLALMELKAREEKELEEMEEREKENWNRKSHILPLSLAADDEFFNKYWPPPPPPEPEPEPEPELKGKAKGKGKSK